MFCWDHEPHYSHRTIAHNKPTFLSLILAFISLLPRHNAHALFYTIIFLLFFSEYLGVFNIVTTEKQFGIYYNILINVKTMYIFHRLSEGLPRMNRNEKSINRVWNQYTIYFFLEDPDALMVRTLRWIWGERWVLLMNLVTI